MLFDDDADSTLGDDADIEGSDESSVSTCRNDNKILCSRITVKSVTANALLDFFVCYS